MLLHTNIEKRLCLVYEMRKLLNDCFVDLCIHDHRILAGMAAMQISCCESALIEVESLPHPVKM